MDNFMQNSDMKDKQQMRPSRTFLCTYRHTHTHTQARAHARARMQTLRFITSYDFTTGLPTNQWMDGWTDGRTNGRTDGPMDGHNLLQRGEDGSKNAHQQTFIFRNLTAVGTGLPKILLFRCVRVCPPIRMSV